MHAWPNSCRPVWAAGSSARASHASEERRVILIMSVTGIPSRQKKGASGATDGSDETRCRLIQIALAWLLRGPGRGHAPTWRTAKRSHPGRKTEEECDRQEQTKRTIGVPTTLSCSVCKTLLTWLADAVQPNRGQRVAKQAGSQYRATCAKPVAQVSDDFHVCKPDGTGVRRFQPLQNRRRRCQVDKGWTCRRRVLAAARRSCGCTGCRSHH